MEKLRQYGVKAFELAREAEDTPEARSEFVAYTVGACAKRMGMSEEELSKWFQGAYSFLWVKESNLNPGLDAKDVRRYLLQGYETCNPK